MGSIYLLNDVETALHAEGLIVGDQDDVLTKNGQDQCLLFSKKIAHKLKDIRSIYASPASYLKKYIHHIRSTNKKMVPLSPVFSEGFKERNFGVFSGSKCSIKSDIFNHTRVKAEGGESINECRTRTMKPFTKITNLAVKKNILIISHPFVCQIITNVVLNKDHTILSEFWLTKGSMCRIKVKTDKGSLSYKIAETYNAISDKAYSEETLYSRLSEEKRN